MLLIRKISVSSTRVVDSSEICWLNRMLKIRQNSVSSTRVVDSSEFCWLNTMLKIHHYRSRSAEMLVLGEQVVQDPKKDEINQLIYKKNTSSQSRRTNKII